jgi:hypothetical protein
MISIMGFRKNIVQAMLLAVALGASVAQAGLVNDVPSCYGAFHLTPAPAPDRAVYVLIDQTVLLDKNLQQQVIDNITRVIEPGAKFVIAKFSAFSQGHYFDVLHTGVVEPTLPEDAYDSLPITKAPNIRKCFKDQLDFARNMANTAALQAMGESTSSLNASEVMGAISQIGQALRTDPVQKKVLFLVSDGLENSRATSFYANNGVRDINPKVELDKARANNMLADLAGAKVYVLGGALMPPAAKGTQAQRDGYRDTKTIQNLRAFWQGYFESSNAHLAEFGTPALVTPVAY